MSISVGAYKAQPVGDRLVYDGLIKINEPMPHDRGDTSKIMQLDAEHIADVLWETLPGGTLDRLVAEMLRRHASLLIVRHERPKP